MDEKGVFLVKGAAVGMGLPKVTIYSYLTRQEGKKRKEQLMQKITMVNEKENKGHYTPGIIAGGMLYVSGQLPLDPATRSCSAVFIWPRSATGTS